MIPIAPDDFLFGIDDYINAWPLSRCACYPMHAFGHAMGMFAHHAFAHSHGLASSPHTT